MNIVCRHDRLIEEGCKECLGPEDWHIEGSNMVEPLKEITVTVRLPADSDVTPAVVQARVIQGLQLSGPSDARIPFETIGTSGVKSVPQTRIKLVMERMVVERMTIEFDRDTDEYLENTHGDDVDTAHPMDEYVSWLNTVAGGVDFDAQFDTARTAVPGSGERADGYEMIDYGLTVKEIL